jgi:hypothetical protein
MLAELTPQSVPFDMRGVEFGHHGHDCTFETLLRRHDLDDPALWRVAQIVHEADLDDGLLGSPPCTSAPAIPPSSPPSLLPSPQRCSRSWPKPWSESADARSEIPPWSP